MPLQFAYMSEQMPSSAYPPGVMAVTNDNRIMIGTLGHQCDGINRKHGGLTVEFLAN